MLLQEYKEKHPQKAQRLTRWENDLKVADIMLDLAEHEGVKKLLEDLEKAIESINAQLIDGKVKTELEQERLYTDRERCEWFINIFTGQKVKKENILKKLEEL